MATEYGPEKYVNIHNMARQDKQTTQVKSRTEESDARERVAGNASSATGCIQSLSSIFLEALLQRL